MKIIIYELYLKFFIKLTLITKVIIFDDRNQS